MLWKWSRCCAKYWHGKSMLSRGYLSRRDELQNGVHSYIFNIETWWLKIDDKIGWTLPISFTKRPFKPWSKLLHGSFLLERYRNIKEPIKQFLLHLKSSPTQPSRCISKTWWLLLLRILCWEKLWLRKEVIRYGQVDGEYSGYA